MPVHNAEIAEMFDQTAELLEIKGDNPYRTRAYRRAARVLEGLSKSAAAMLSAGEDLAELPGIGRDLAGKIASIVETGKFDVLQSLKRELPGDLSEIVAIPGLGPKRVKILIDELGIRSIEDVRRAVKTGRLGELHGFGPKLQQNIASAIAKPIAAKRFKRPFAETEVSSLIDWLRPSLDGGRIVVAGSFRRRRDTVGDLDVVATSANAAAAVGNKLAQYENVAQVIVHGPTRTTVVLRSGLQVDLRAVKEESYGAALLYFTGSKAHNIALRNIAVNHGWKLNEYGLFNKTRSIAGATEEEIYKKLGLQFVPPELREDRGEIARAQKNTLPKLVQLSDIRGDLHVHSSWSDGNTPIAEMAQAAQACGYEYMALTDHSRRVTVAHGLDRARLLRQIKDVDRLNAKMRGFTVLKGVEVDILADGALDLPDEVLSRLDLVVAAVHYKFDLPRERQTERILRALDNRHVSILAHPTGRLIEERPPYELDLEPIMVAAKERGCFLEINAEPDRLDLTDVAAKAAKELGVRIAISTDAHSIAALDYMRFGVDQARRGWLEPGDVINTRSLVELKKLLRR